MVGKINWHLKIKITTIGGRKLARIIFNRLGGTSREVEGEDTGKMSISVQHTHTTHKWLNWKIHFQ